MWPLETLKVLLIKDLASAVPSFTLQQPLSGQLCSDLPEGCYQALGLPLEGEGLWPVAVMQVVSLSGRQWALCSWVAENPASSARGG